MVDAGGEVVGRASRVAAARGDRRRACRAVGEEIPWDTVSLRHPRRAPLRPSRPGSPQRRWWGAVISGGEGVGPSFVPCRMGGVRLRSHRVNKFSPKFQLLPRMSSLLKFVAHVMRLTVSSGKRSMKHTEFVDLEVSSAEAQALLMDFESVAVAMRMPRTLRDSPPKGSVTPDGISITPARMRLIGRLPKEVCR